MAGYCEYGNEPLGSMKYGAFLDCMSFSRILFHGDGWDKSAVYSRNQMKPISTLWVVCRVTGYYVGRYI